MTAARTLEERIKFDHGLPVGQSLVRFTLGENSRLALVEISNRGQVWYFTKPNDGDMYSSWTRVRGDNSLSGSGAVKVWAVKDLEFMAKFEAIPAADIPVKL
jgi:hypothetical protein